MKFDRYQIIHIFLLYGACVGLAMWLIQHKVFIYCVPPDTSKWMHIPFYAYLASGLAIMLFGLGFLWIALNVLRSKV